MGKPTKSVAAPRATKSVAIPAPAKLVAASGLSPSKAAAGPTAHCRAVAAALWARCDRTWVHACLIVALPAIVFSNSLGNSFQLDDYYLVADNPGIHSVSPIWRHFVDPTTQATLPQLRGYRPMLPLTLSLNYAIAGDSVVGYHLANLAFQICASWLVYLLVVRLLSLAPPGAKWAMEPRRARNIGLCVALLFAVHPVSGIPVNYIAGRDQLLSQIFWSAALLVYLRMRQRGSTALGWMFVVVLFVFSLASKLSAALAPLIVLWLELTVFQQSLKKAGPWLRAAGFGAPVVGLALFQKYVIGFMPEVTNNLTGSGERIDWSYALTQARLHLWRYLPQFVWPLSIRQDPWEPFAKVVDFQVFSGLVFIAASLVVAWRWRRSQPVVSFCIVAYWLMIAPTSSLAPLYYVVADYRPYGSSPFIFVAACIVGLKLSAPVRRYAVVGAIVWAATTSYYLNTTWLTGKTLWGYSVKQGGGWLAHHNLAMSTSDLQERRSLLEEALRLAPTYLLAMVNLGRTMVSQGHIPEGLAHLERAKALGPNDQLVRYWYARTLVELNRTDEASRESSAAARLDPRNLKTVAQAALAAQAANDVSESAYWIGVLKSLGGSEAAAARPEPDTDGRFVRGWALQSQGKLDEAIVEYRSFLSSFPNHVQVRFNLGYALMVKQDCSHAIPEFQRVLELEPDKASAHLHLANCSRAVGNMPTAQLHQTAWDKSQHQHVP